MARKQIIIALTILAAVIWGAAIYHLRRPESGPVAAGPSIETRQTGGHRPAPAMRPARTGVGESTRAGLSQRAPAPRLRLLGTMIGARTRDLALIEDTAGGGKSLLGVGDWIRGARLVTIERNRARLDFQGMIMELAVDFRRGTDPGRAEAVVRLSEAEFDEVLSDAGRAMADVALKARRLKDGSGGLELEQVADQSFAARLGFRAGDVIRQINGADINRPELVAAVYNTVSKLPAPVLQQAPELLASEVIARFGQKATGVGAEVVKVNRLLRQGGALSIVYERGGVSRQLNIRVH